MSAPITAQVSTDEVRNALGVTDNEMSDSMLTGHGLGTELNVALLTWYPTYQTAWDACYNNPGTPTNDEIILGGLIKLYCQWFCVAKASEIWLTMPSQIGDGKAIMRRFGSMDLALLRDNARSRAASFKSQINDILDPTRTKGFTILGKASPDVDPVTGPYPNAARNGVTL